MTGEYMALEKLCLQIVALDCGFIEINSYIWELCRFRGI